MRRLLEATITDLRSAEAVVIIILNGAYPHPTHLEVSDSTFGKIKEEIFTTRNYKQAFAPPHRGQTFVGMNGEIYVNGLRFLIRLSVERRG